MPIKAGLLARKLPDCLTITAGLAIALDLISLEDLPVSITPSSPPSVKYALWSDGKTLVNSRPAALAASVD